MLEVDCVEKRFGPVRAVRGVSFNVTRGEAVGLLGPNGAGKTTTIRLVTGFLPPDAGRVRIGGLDSQDRSLEARRLVGYLPESAPMYPEMTVTGFLAFRAILQRLPRRKRRAAVDRAIERCWLTEMRHRRVGELSKGYRQRVGLAAAILHDPSALLLDEPTNGLDPTQITQMRALMRELAQDRAVIVSSHILAEVEKTCDRVIVIANGRVRADAPVAELFHRAGVHIQCVIEARPRGQGEAQSLVKSFTAIPGIVDVTETPLIETGEATPGGTNAPEPDTALPWRRYCLRHARAGAPHESGLRAVAEEAGRIVQDRGIPIRELRVEAPTLEQVFLDLLARTKSPEDE